VCHGGLFRKPPPPARKRSRAQREEDDAAAAAQTDGSTTAELDLSLLGSLEDLRADARKYADPGDEDEMPEGRLVSDFVWSDPAAKARTHARLSAASPMR
jgi:hypothetical protein